MTNTHIIEHLLSQVTDIRHHYEQDMLQNGGNWNLFYNIGRTLYEKELLHSYLIASILKIQLTPQTENLFLRWFLEQVQSAGSLQTNFSSFYTGSVKITTEKYIGQISNGYVDGGRIDILIEKGNQQIVIENKINAEDQPNQLARYHQKYPKATLVYLTLNGKNPSKQSLGNLQEYQYICLSYYTHILQWLAKCKQYTQGRKDCLFLHTALKQYLDLISDLTGQGRFSKMTQQICDFLSQNESSLLAAQDIYNSFISARNKVLQDRLLTPLAKYVTQRYDSQAKLMTVDRDKNGIINEFRIQPTAWKNIILRFNNELGGIGGLSFKDPNAMQADASAIKNFVAKLPIEQQEDAPGFQWWPLMLPIEPNRHFWDLSVIQSLFTNADEMLTHYQEKIDLIWDIAKQIESNGLEL